MYLSIYFTRLMYSEYLYYNRLFLKKLQNEPSGQKQGVNGKFLTVHSLFLTTRPYTVSCFCLIFCITICS